MRKLTIMAVILLVIVLVLIAAVLMSECKTIEKTGTITYHAKSEAEDILKQECTDICAMNNGEMLSGQSIGDPRGDETSGYELDIKCECHVCENFPMLD